MASSTEVDVSTLEFVELCSSAQDQESCEHPAHSYGPHHEDGGEQYIQFMAKACGCAHLPEDVVVACRKWLDGCRQAGGVYCPKCVAVHPFGQYVKVIGPVKGT